MEILGCCNISTTWICVAGILLLIYVYGKWRNRLFKDIGIPGPEPIIYIGNFHQIIKQGVNFEDPFGKKYGPVYGMFAGGFPIIIVSDPDIMREVLVKQFQNFTDRMIIDLDDFPINKGLFFEKGAAWRRIRHITSPTFSGAKMRLMCERINKCATLLTNNFLKAASADSDVLVKDYFGGYTLDVIASTAFGIDAGSQNEMNNQLMQEAKKVFGDVNLSNPLTALAVMFPSTTPLLKMLGVSSFPKKSIQFFDKVIKEMIEHRKSAAGKAEKRKDFLQLLIDAEDDGTLSDNAKGDKKMTHDEILGQALLFFVAGYETTANTLQFVAYALATHPDVQQRVIDEIDSVLGDTEPSYDTITELTYLEHVITETLRLFPVVPTLTRAAEKTVVIKGYTFPKGVIVTIPSMNIHRNPYLYPEPERFKPERWEKKEIDPMSYLPFGHGPRHCIGMRLAQLEMKIALAHVLKKVRFVAIDDTPAVLESKDFKMGGSFTVKNPIKLKVKAL